MSNGFSKLPNEILDLILGRLNKHDWTMLTRCCQHLHNRINPVLYQSIETPCYCIGIHKTLVYTLLTHPELARSVRSLKIGRLPYGADPKSYANHQHEHHDSLSSKPGLFQLLQIPGSKSWKRRLSDIIQNLADRKWERTQWIEDLQSGTHRDPWLAILLSLLPNLETIELFWGGSGTRYSSWVLSKISQRCKPFDTRPFWTNLHTAIIKIPEDEGADTNFHRLIPFFILPSIRTFKGQLLTDKYLEPTLNIERSPLTNLEFIQCSSVLGFNYLIKICPNLHSFKYMQQEDNCLHRSPGYNNIYFDTLRPTPLKDALATRKDTLQSVTVDVSRRSSNYGGFYSDDWIGCMNDFTQLRSLHIRAANFVGLGRSRRLDVNPSPRVPLVEFLPGCIEEVWISEVEDRILGTITGELFGLVCSGERFGKVRRIDVEGKNWLKGRVENIGEEAWRKLYPDYGVLLREDVLVATEEVRTACLRRGIEFHVRDMEVEVVFEEYDDVFLFVRGDDEED
ncbi:uncharacterized protein N7496_004929 [Penicillium cataractarum]|uniref:F-box domain-containing protein n=1 Tax=Penicillium cataractarum TaxID=2100454 RepID=A0A9W9SGD4_9EURO|nr:uncharacterized protein N7496_004929 [Penicillium cataractarum]KAJ5377520.1 hypothetical protein N7496_004929 [Penicillium cataractarum]